MWALRCVHESKMHEKNCFLTLTYDDDKYVGNGSLDYGDFQRFCKRARKEVGPFRFYMCGEYGGRNGRPHFHSCIFGVGFDDKKYYRTLPSGARVYRSDTLERLWPYGYSTVGDVTFESAAYCARYVCKKVTGEMAEQHYARVNVETGEMTSLKPEFCQMSLKPGIGAGYFTKWLTDLYPRDFCVVNGQKHPVPRYYGGLLQLIDPFMYDDVTFDRENKALEFTGDNTPERLKAQETCAIARVAFKKRTL